MTFCPREDLPSRIDELQLGDSPRAAADLRIVGLGGTQRFLFVGGQFLASALTSVESLSNLASGASDVFVGAMGFAGCCAGVVVTSSTFAVAAAVFKLRMDAMSCDAYDAASAAPFAVGGSFVS
jgi:hypothetical protein